MDDGWACGCGCSQRRAERSENRAQRKTKQRKEKKKQSRQQTEPADRITDRSIGRALSLALSILDTQLHAASRFVSATASAITLQHSDDERRAAQRSQLQDGFAVSARSTAPPPASSHAASRHMRIELERGRMGDCSWTMSVADHALPLRPAAAAAAVAAACRMTDPPRHWRRHWSPHSDRARAAA